jgi:hypothetical protein
VERSLPALPLNKGELEGVETPEGPPIRNVSQPFPEEGSSHDRN